MKKDNFQSLLESGEIISKKSKNFKVSFEYIGEGYDGSYDPNNNNDQPLLRCDLVYNKNPNEPIHNGSFCTLISTNVKKSELENLITKMLEEMESLLKELGEENLSSIGRSMATYSWNKTDESGKIQK